MSNCVSAVCVDAHVEIFCVVSDVNAAAVCPTCQQQIVLRSVFINLLLLLVSSTVAWPLTRPSSHWAHPFRVSVVTFCAGGFVLFSWSDTVSLFKIILMIIIIKGQLNYCESDAHSVRQHTSLWAACIFCLCCVLAKPAWRLERIRRDVVDVVLNPRVLHFCQCLSLCGGEGDISFALIRDPTLIPKHDSPLDTWWALFYMYRLHFKGTEGKQLYWLFSLRLDNIAEPKLKQHRGFHHVTYNRCISPKVLIIQCRGKVAIRWFFFFFFQLSDYNL